MASELDDVLSRLDSIASDDGSTSSCPWLVRGRTAAFKVLDVMLAATRARRPALSARHNLVEVLLFLLDFLQLYVPSAPRLRRTWSTHECARKQVLGRHAG